MTNENEVKTNEKAIETIETIETNENEKSIETNEKAIEKPKAKAKGKSKSKAKAKGKNKGEITVKALTDNVKVTQAKTKANRATQVANRGIPAPRNEMVKAMIENGPVLKNEVIQAIIEKYPSTSLKMAKRTITRAKNEKYNKKYIHFKNLVIEQVINDEKYLAFTKKAFIDLQKSMKTKANKNKAKAKASTKATEKV